MPYESEDQAIEMQRSVYGLGGYVQSKDVAHARKVAGRLRAGQVS